MDNDRKIININSLHTCLTKTEYRKLEELQMFHFDEGFAKDKDFVQLECWKKAVEEIKQLFNLSEEKL